MRRLWLWIALFDSSAIYSQMLEAYGDSLTAGFLSEFSIMKAPPLSRVTRVVSDIAAYRLTGSTRYITPFIRRDLSWAKYVADTMALTPSNHAFPAHHSGNLRMQIGRVANPQDSKISLSFIGHNDMCDNSDEVEILASDFAKSIEEGISDWDKAHSNATFYFIPVAEIWQVYDLLSKTVWLEDGAHKYRCEDSWQKFFPYCITHFRMHRLGTLETFLRPRVLAVNRELQRLSEKWDRISTSNNHFVYLKGLEHLGMKKEFFSIDCFHLSDLGQRELARKVSAEIARSKK